MNTGITVFVVALAMAVSTVTFGCAKQETPVDRFYGTSYELAKESQIHNPRAGIDSGPPTGLDGDIAVKVIKRYQSGFEKPAAKTKVYSVEASGVDVE